MCLRNIVLFLSIGVYFAHSKPLQQLTCKDEGGNPVDWFYIYKLPRVKYHSNKLINDGTAYVYITPSTTEQGWLTSHKSINDSTSMAGQTLALLYQNADIAAIIYNDESIETEYETQTNRNVHGRVRDRAFYTTNETLDREYENFNQIWGIRKSSNGHTKGVVLADSNTGIWLIHSVPKFPPLPSTGSRYNYPFTATRFGQTFLCLTLKSDSLNDVSKQLWYNEPHLRYSSLPSSLHFKYNNLLRLVEGKTDLEPPWFRAIPFTTYSSAQFVSFAKSSRYHDDLYSGMVAPGLKSSLLVESWRNEAGSLGAECSKTYKVLDIETLKFDLENITFSSRIDHSKWCSSTVTSNTFWVCVGDINRALPQEGRGGGTVCISDKNLWKHFTDTVVTSENCSTPSVGKL